MTDEIREEINKILKENYNTLLLYICRTVKDMHLSKELLHDIVVLIHEPHYEETVNKFYSEDKLINLIFSLAFYYKKPSSKNAVQQKYKIQKEAVEINNFNIDHNYIEPEDIFHEEKTIVEQLEYIEGILRDTNQLHWTEKKIFNEYIYNYDSYREFSEKTGLSASLLSHRVNHVRKILKLIMSGELDIIDKHDIINKLYSKKRFRKKTL